MTEETNTREDAAARIAARGEEVTLGKVLVEQGMFKVKRPEKLKIMPTKANKLVVRRVGRIEK